MQDDIEKLRGIFASDDVEEETRTENFAVLREWERDLRALDDFDAWREHPVTQSIVAEAKKTYVQDSLYLVRERRASEKERLAIWGKQDAMLWLISLVSKDVSTEKANIEAEIKHALLTT